MHVGLYASVICKCVLLFGNDAGKVAPYMKLRGGVQFVTAIPKSPSGKILRRKIREEIRKAKL